MRSSDLRVRPLRHADVHAALRLSTQAGWNQIAADWSRLIDLWPDGCFAGFVENEIVATATLASYGANLAWVGMVLVDERCRGRGFGGVIFDTAMQHAAQLGCRSVGLDASDLGRPVYLKRGFADGPIIRRHALPAGATRRGENGADPLAVDRDWSALIDLDRTAVGVDRERLLAHFRDESGTVCRVVRSGDQIVGYAFRRRGRTADQIGPVVATDVYTAQRLIASLASCDASTDLLIDCPDRRLDPWLAEQGFVVSRQLVRMYNSPFVNASGSVRAIAGLELG